MKPPFVILAGPTASGKTDLAIRLAQKIHGEIVTADSMQVYRYMDIGTAKPDLMERNGVPHHMIDIVNPDESFSVADYQHLAKKAIETINKAGRVPILAGGTGFYINAVLYNNTFTETQADYKLREQLSALAAQKGNQYIHDQLRRIDPVSAENIHANNVKRVIRAIEYYEQTGQRFSLHNIEEKKKKPFYNAPFFILDMPREDLYKRIDERVDLMVKKGLVEEVASLLKNGYGENLASMQGLGYKEIIPYLQNKCPLAEAIETLKKNTRHFAKRQLTWFRHQCEGNWINIIPKTEKNGIIEKMCKHLETMDLDASSAFSK